MRRVKRSRQPKPDILTAAWIAGELPPVRELAEREAGHKPKVAIGTDGWPAR